MIATALASSMAFPMIIAFFANRRNTPNRVLLNLYIPVNIANFIVENVAQYFVNSCANYNIPTIVNRHYAFEKITAFTYLYVITPVLCIKAEFFVNKFYIFVYF